ncbi:NAD-dependent epimerase/dehydratase family protein [Solidesulfovibrio sp. C21]|uniref:NAD-dependent epimerase/dehydratase family protein n=1 Tax=Solidesulfovibrio sp. C21 TaxID=3398613 RepID=UPI0039FD9C58
MKLQGKNILVTGGAGFIGSHIVESLLAKGARVTVLDNLQFGRKENLRAVLSDIVFVEGDILDNALLARLMPGMDAVSHQAAQLEILLATSNPLWDLQVNTIGTINILEAAKAAGVEKVVNASSACVYGQKNGATRENDGRHPNWTYGVSKLASEEYCRIYNDSKGLPTVSLRYAIVYGEREWYRRALPIFLKRTIDGRPPVVFGDGRQYRDFIHVSDIVALHDRCLESDAANGLSLNASTGKGVSIAELAALVSRLFHTGEVITENLPEGGVSQLVTDKKRNTDELKSMILDPGEAERLLGWNAVIPLEEGLRREYEWARANPGRWDSIRYTDSK